MKKLIFFLFLVSLYSCSNSTSVEESEKYFSPNDLGKLELESFNEFWEINQTTDTLLAASTHFNSDPRILESLGFRSDIKGIEVSVFTSKEAAILSLEERINSVACIIIEGDSKLMEGKKWWYSDCIPNIVFINQWNTIIEVYEYNNDFDNVIVKLKETTLKIATSVDTMSE